MKTHSPDAYICPGDIVGYGANPCECIAIVRELDPIIVAGNHDWAAVGKIPFDYFNYYAREAIIWTNTLLNDDEHKYLVDLPIFTKHDGFSLFHSTVYRPELFSYIQTSYDAHLSFEALDTDVAFLGHSHIPVTFLCQDYISFTLDTFIILEEGEKALVNVGSVGQPRDENPDSAYGIYDDVSNTIELFRVEYDIKSAAKAIKDAGLPNILADRLFVGQ